MEKFCTARQVTDDNIVYAHRILDIYSYEHRYRIRNTYCFSTVTVVARRRFSVTCTLPVLLVLSPAPVS